MEDLIKKLTEEKAKIEADVEKKKLELFDLNIKIKSLEKAIKALKPA